MKQALAAVKNKTMGWLRASKMFNVPLSTLRRRSMKSNKIAIGTKKHLGRHESTFNTDFENALIENILDLEARFFGMSSTANWLSNLLKDWALNISSIKNRKFPAKGGFTLFESSILKYHKDFQKLHLRRVQRLSISPRWKNIFRRWKK